MPVFGIDGLEDCIRNDAVNIPCRNEDNSIMVEDSKLAVNGFVLMIREEVSMFVGSKTARSLALQAGKNVD
jgi:hypothetical protein